jgi:DNA-directed RNA polymerase specialized sigma24 family protein
VVLSAQSQVSGSKEALAELCRLYWYPLYAHVRRYGFSPHDAQDLTQGFFLDILEHKALTRADQQKGKFRSFLLASLKNFLSNEGQKARCLKRGGQVQFVYVDFNDAEDRYGKEEPAESLTPEKIFDARWALALLSEANTRLRQEYIDTGKIAVFDVLKDFVDPVSSNTLPSYEEAGKQLNLGVATVKTLIHRLRKRNTAIVREEIMRTVSDAADVEAESRELCEALIAAEGKILP